jgi:putative tricarboxylic transport membrane protein
MKKLNFYKRRIGFGIFLIIFSILGYSGTASIPNRAGLEVSASFFPRLIFSILVFFSVLLIFNSYQKYKVLKKENNGEEEKEEEKAEIHYNLLFLSLLTTISYGFLLKPIGFVPVSIGFMIIQMWIMTSDMTIKKFILNTVLSSAIVFGLYYLFTTVFYVPLP